MTVHLLKLSVGSESVESMARWQAMRLAEHGRIFHRTRHAPRRAEEVLDGGSIYWVIKRFVQVRQRIIGFEKVDGDDGITRCLLLLDPELIRTVAQPRRPHQGWRYLDPEDAPPDIGPIGDHPGNEPPPEMAAELRALGLI